MEVSLACNNRVVVSINRAAFCDLLTPCSTPATVINSQKKHPITSAPTPKSTTCNQSNTTQAIVNPGRDNNGLISNPCWNNNSRNWLGLYLNCRQRALKPQSVKGTLSPWRLARHSQQITEDLLKEIETGCAKMANRLVLAVTGNGTLF